MMTFQEKYSRLLSLIDCDDLNNEEIKFIQWISKWTDWEYDQLNSIIKKVKKDKK
jgi:hypothetical protein